MRRLMVQSFAALALVAIGFFFPPLATSVAAAEPAAESPTARGDRMLAEYFRLETKRLEERCLADVRTAADWNARRGEYRAQLFDMLGLNPLPEKSPLEPVVTGTLERDGIRVEKLHFQSLPGLYVTGNLYRPAKLECKAPTILYVCGHSRQVRDGRSFGNKAGYQHHGVGFARNGYVCLIIDSLQLGEIEGLHHGLYDKQMWWWLNRGYTPAGIEAWNCIRALDYLETRPEVDRRRIGVTGRSGGGIYSWWVAALDDRIAAAVPVAGITSLRNHVVDGCIEGHCDCMYHMNALGWDFPQVAALVAPRPLLILNTDADPIFPESGVVAVHDGARRIYELLGARDRIDLRIGKGGHQDTELLQTLAFRFFNEHLMEDPGIDCGMGTNEPRLGDKRFEVEELAVFDQLPTDSFNSQVHETFVPKAPQAVMPRDAAEWDRTRHAILNALRAKTFAAWPSDPPEAAPKPAFSAAHGDIALAAYDFTSQGPFELRLYVARRTGPRPANSHIVLNVLDERDWRDFDRTLRPAFDDRPKDARPTGERTKEIAPLFETLKPDVWGMAWVAPRGIGLTAWNEPGKKATHIRRRFMLLGQTLDSARVWDVRRAVQALRAVPGMSGAPLHLHGERDAAGLALYAALFEPKIERLDLHDLPATHRNGPYFLNVSRILDMPRAVALAAENSAVRLVGNFAPDAWSYPEEVAKSLGWGATRIRIDRE
ncbi:MAG: alpha/beta hydrolase family protein [Planctomycetales bacterium]